MGNDAPKTKKTEILPYLIIIIAFFFLLSQTWLKWGNLIIDTGRELWLPGELLKGKILYKDIVSPYGFLQSYLIAGLYKIFGVSVNTLVYTGVVVTLIVLFTIYRIARFFLGTLLSTALAINFLFVMAFANYGDDGLSNFILPYTFASTFFMMFTALSLYFFLKFIFFGNEKHLVIWSILLAAACLSRPESALAVWPGFAVSGFVWAMRKPKVELLKISGYMLLPLLLTVLSYWLFFSLTGTYSDFQKSYLANIVCSRNIIITKKASGLSDIPGSISRICASSSLNMVIFISLALICRAMACLNRAKPAVKMGGPLLAAFLFFIVLKQSHLYELQYYCLTLVLICGTIGYFLQALRRTTTPHILGLLALFSTSLLATCRIFLNTAPPNYGFFLLTLPLICYYVFWGGIIKSALEKHFKIPEGPLSIAMAGFLMLMIIPFWKYSDSAYKYHTLSVTTPRGKLYCDDSVQSVIFWQTVVYLKKNTPKKSSVVVFPEGIGINFFAERNMPVKYPYFLPHTIMPIGEQKIVEEMKTADIDYVIIISRDPSAWGAASFGVDYAKKIRAWIDANYIPIKQFGDMPYTKRFTIGSLILKKK